jgi:hypothetical protein
MNGQTCSSPPTISPSRAPVMAAYACAAALCVRSLCVPQLVLSREVDCNNAHIIVQQLCCSHAPLQTLAASFIEACIDSHVMSTHQLLVTAYRNLSGTVDEDGADHFNERPAPSSSCSSSSSSSSASGFLSASSCGGGGATTGNSTITFFERVIKVLTSHPNFASAQFVHFLIG